MWLKMTALAVLLVATTETRAEHTAVPVEDLDAAESQSYGYGYGTKVQDKYSVATGRAGSRGPRVLTYHDALPWLHSLRAWIWHLKRAL